MHSTTMKAHVYHGPGRHSWEDVPDPQFIDRPTPSCASTR